jgi:UDP-N-acetylmuramyl pentapeptide phosphotransferase/UDP-N-acetylglucosamine-1-phosphate transferase
MAPTILAALLASFAAAWVIVSTWRLHGKLGQDAGGPQTFHVEPTPRIGGVAIALGIALGAVAAGRQFPAIGALWGALLLAAVPAFLGGLIEDLTKRVRAYHRLLLTFFSAAIGFFLLDARVTSIDVPGLDLLLETAAFSFLFTLFAVGGFTHALNIVDGFNGIAGGVALLILAGMGMVAVAVDDQLIFVSCLLLGAAIGGFLLWNFPRGRIFAGDGGAYLLGFLIAELAVLLVHRNTEISPWFPPLLFAYPLFETFFSIYRKKLLRGRSPGQPDGLHLHMLVYRRLVKWKTASGDPRHRIARNSLTAPYLWIVAAIPIVPAGLFWDSTSVLVSTIAVFCLIYVWLYWRIVRFRAPRSLVLRNSGLAGEQGRPRSARDAHPA